MCEIHLRYVEAPPETSERTPFTPSLAPSSHIAWRGPHIWTIITERFSFIQIPLHLHTRNTRLLNRENIFGSCLRKVDNVLRLFNKSSKVDGNMEHTVLLLRNVKIKRNVKHAQT